MFSGGVRMFSWGVRMFSGREHMFSGRGRMFSAMRQIIEKEVDIIYSYDMMNEIKSFISTRGALD